MPSQHCSTQLQTLHDMFLCFMQAHRSTGSQAGVTGLMTRLALRMAACLMVPRVPPMFETSSTEWASMTKRLLPCQVLVDHTHTASAIHQTSSHFWLSCLLLAASRGCYVRCIVKLLITISRQAVQSVWCTLVLSWAGAIAESLLHLNCFSDADSWACVNLFLPW